MAENQAQDDGVEAIPRTIDPETGLPRLGVIQYYDKDKSFTQAIADGRMENPLRELASYTYNLTLYMVTPEAYTIFLAQGQQIASKGFYVVATSGGSDAQGTPRIKDDREYFIDDVSFKTVVNPKASASATMSHSFDIKIIEPFGFSLTSVLKAKIEQISNETAVTKGNTDPMQAFYVLAVKFIGYDDLGTYRIADTLSLEKGSAGLQSTAQQAFTVSYFPLTIAEFNFKLDGKGTTYNIKAVPTSIQEAYSITRSQIQNPSELAGTTIGEILGDAEGNTGLMGLLNKKEKELNGDKANVYKIVISDGIKNQKIISPERYDKLKSKGAYATNSRESSALNSVNNYGYNPASRNFSVTKGTPIVKFIDNVILTSEYVTNSLNTIYTNDSETEAVPNSDEQGLSWYMINPVVTPRGYDDAKKRNIYTITYYIDRYKIPYVRSVFVTNSKKTPYYGAYKKYNYYFTGKNTEVINFEMTYNNLYFIPGKSNTTSTPQTPSSEPVKSSPDMKTQGMDTEEAKAGNPVGSIKTNLYSPGDQATATLQILGDPDWLMTTIGTTPNATTPREAAYGKGYSINPVTGQCFIEVNFYEGVDYDLSTGLLKVNKNIQFYSVTTDSIAGIVFLVTEVTSYFSRGKFTQNLNLVLWPEAELRKSGVITNDGRETASASVNTDAQGFSSSTTPAVQTTEANTTLNQGQAFVAQTNQSIVNTITGVSNSATMAATPAQIDTIQSGGVSVAFNQTANYYAASVVDDDSYTTSTLANQFIDVNQEGRVV